MNDDMTTRYVIAIVFFMLFIVPAAYVLGAIFWTWLLTKIWGEP